MIRRLKLTLSGDNEDKFGYIRDLQELWANKKFLETRSQSNTVNICLKNFRSVQNMYQKIVNFWSEFSMNTIIEAAEACLKPKPVVITILSSMHNFVCLHNEYAHV